MKGLWLNGLCVCICACVYGSVVVSGKWMTDQVFLDGIALVNCLPTPLVMFVCFDGFYVDRVTSTTGLVGAVLMTTGIFMPAFSFILVFHEVFEKAMEQKYAPRHPLSFSPTSPQPTTLFLAGAPS